MTGEPAEKLTMPSWTNQHKRRYALKLIRAHTSSSTVFIVMMAIVFLADFGITLRALQILAFGAAIVAWGFHLWVEDSLPSVYEKAFGEADELNLSRW